MQSDAGSTVLPIGFGEWVTSTIQNIIYSDVERCETCTHLQNDGWSAGPVKGDGLMY